MITSSTLARSTTAASLIAALACAAGVTLAAGFTETDLVANKNHSPTPMASFTTRSRRQTS